MRCAYTSGGIQRLTLLQEYIIRGIRHALERACLVASACRLAALGIDPQHCGYGTEYAGAAVGGHGEFQPGNVLVGRARRVAGCLGYDRAAVDVLPVRADIVPSDGFPVEKKRRDRFAELPGQFAAFCRLALVDLRA